MVKSKDIFVPFVIPHLVFEAHRMKVSKVQLESWHATMAKLHDLPTQPIIDQTNVNPRVVVMHNEKGMFQLRGASTRRYRPIRVLLDSLVQPLMLGKTIIDGLGLTDVNLDPCPYHILTSMGGLKEAQRLTK
jgi:hypothetical protein